MGIALTPSPRQQFIDANGNPIASGKVYTYVAGTTTPLATYTDSTGDTPNANPVVLDTSGRAPIWLTSGSSYKFVVKTSADTLIYTEDGIAAPASSAALTASSGATLIGFIQSGSGAVRRTAQAKLRDFVNVLDYGATGDNSADDTTAFVSALAAAKTVIVPTPLVAYKITSSIALAANRCLQGYGKWNTKLTKAFNGDMFTLADGAALKDLYIEGVGATYTGRGIVISGTDGNQLIENCRLLGSDGYAIEFTDKEAGSRFCAINCNIERYNGTAAGRYAVKIEDDLINDAVPRHFIGIETGGTKFIDLGGANDLFITNSFVGAILYSDNSLGVHISNSRVGVNETAGNLAGFNNTIVGCDIAPQITVASGTGECVIQGCTYNNAVPIVDNSGLGSRNKFDIGVVSYTPTITAGSGGFVLGNGLSRGMYSRAGGIVHVVIEFVVGSTTNCGTGDLRFSLPFTPVQTGTGIEEHQGSGYVVDDSAGDRTLGVVVAAINEAYCSLMLGGTNGKVTFNTPYTLATDDLVRLSISYPA